VRVVVVVVLGFSGGRSGARVEEQGEAGDVDEENRGVGLRGDVKELKRERKEGPEGRIGRGSGEDHECGKGGG
jgi:hypothetical protein